MTGATLSPTDIGSNTRIDLALFQATEGDFRPQSDSTAEIGPAGSGRGGLTDDDNGHDS